MGRVSERKVCRLIFSTPTKKFSHSRIAVSSAREVWRQKSIKMSLQRPQQNAPPAVSSQLDESNPSPALISDKTDLLISVSLYNWPALSLAIQNHWGGPSSADKRDWFAGSISELLSTKQVIHVDDLEEVLLQVMNDEFEIVVDDESAFHVATEIWKGRERIQQGDFGEVDALYAKWQDKQRRGENQNPVIKHVQENEDGQDTDWDEDSEEDDEDAEMEDAPPLVEVRRKEKPEPEVDEDGFTKVVGKKKR